MSVNSATSADKHSTTTNVFHVTPALFTIEGLVHYVGMSRSRIYQMVKEGEFPSQYKHGKSSLWDRESVDLWVSQFIKTSKLQQAAE
jgi:predicted DNA-binding transcriptional regulator AlpA